MTRIQQGIPRSQIRPSGRHANGLLIPGVVTATFVVDSPGHPKANAPDPNIAVAVYCDVLVFPSIAGQRWFGLKKVLVSQEVAGLHRGRIWKPRPAKLDWTDDLDLDAGSNPAYVDGDHVLVGFMNDNLSQPVILRSLPHPSMDLGREENELGRRMRIQEADKDPDFFRHHGIHYGVDDLGNFVLNTNFANNGILEDDGKESAPPTDDTQGNVTMNIPLESKVTMNVNDMADPDAPEMQAQMIIQKNAVNITIKDTAGVINIDIEEGKHTLIFNKGKLEIKLDSGANTILVEGKDAAAVLTLGNGAVKVAVADHLETLYTGLKGKLDASDAHVHPTGVGPSGPPNPPIVADPWDSNINSDKITLPDTG